LATSSPPDVWRLIAADAQRESPLWAGTLLPDGARDEASIFSTLSEDRFAVGIETIYEGYLLHYGRARLFAPADDDVRLLLGDYLYAQGLVRVSRLGDVAAVADLAELISLCAHLRADGRPGDGAAWAATAALLGRGMLDEARDELRTTGDPAALLELTRCVPEGERVRAALAAHAGRVG
jgi:hypothetical protein